MIQLEIVDIPTLLMLNQLSNSTKVTSSLARSDLLRAKSES